MVNAVGTLRKKSLPTIYHLRDNLFVACFWLMKLGVAFEMLDQAARTGRIRHGGLIVESTSGTMGYGLAIAGRALGLRVQLVGDPAIDPTFKDFLELLGAEIHIVREHLDVGGYQVPRLNMVHELQRADPDALWVRQYDNPANPASYHTTARMIAQQAGSVDYFVAPVGSGGSISGITRSLRQLGHKARSIAVDTHGSVLFGQADGPRKLRGLGNSVFPKNLNYALIDEVHWVEAADAFLATRQLFADHGLDMGPTTGAAFMVADHIAAANPDQTVVFIGPDRAERYIGTVYSKSWCMANDVYAHTLPEAPYRVTHPSNVYGGWASMHWGGALSPRFCQQLEK